MPALQSAHTYKQPVQRRQVALSSTTGHRDSTTTAQTREHSMARGLELEPSSQRHSGARGKVHAPPRLGRRAWLEKPRPAPTQLCRLRRLRLGGAAPAGTAAPHAAAGRRCPQSRCSDCGWTVGGVEHYECEAAPRWRRSTCHASAGARHVASPRRVRKHRSAAGTLPGTQVPPPAGQRPAASSASPLSNQVRPWPAPHLPGGSRPCTIACRLRKHSPS